MCYIKVLKVVWGIFIGVQKELLGCEYSCDFDGFWEYVQDLKMDGIVIDVEPSKIIGLAGLEGITYSKWEVLEKLKNKSFSNEYKYFTLSTSQYDEMFLLYGYKTKKEMIKVLNCRKNHTIFMFQYSLKYK